MFVKYGSLASVAFQVANRHMPSLCDRCQERPPLSPSRQRFFTATARSPAFEVLMSFSVLRRGGQEAPALCRACHRAEIRQALFALRVDELRGDDIDDHGLGDDER